MKKISLLISTVVAALSLASCQKEQTGPAGVEGDYATVNIAVHAPGQLVTKAVGDGQTADNLVFAVFDEAGNELIDLRQGDWIKNQTELTFNQTDANGNPMTTVKTTLVRGKEYTFVCWAQNKEAVCYDFTSLKEIGVDYSTYNVAQNEKRDAFYAAVQSGKVTDDFSMNIELRRPFAQINVGTDDIQAAHSAGLQVNNLYATMTVANVATKLHTFVGEKAEDNDGDGKVEGNTNVTFTLAPSISKPTLDDATKVWSPNEEWLTVNHEDYKDQNFGWLAMNYILVNDGDIQGVGSVDGTEPVNTTVSFTVYEGEGLELCSYDVPNVTVQRNYRTHILGSVLTAEGTLNVIIEPAFINDEDHVVEIWDGHTVSEPKKDAQGNYLVTKPEELAWFQKNTPDANINLVNDIDLAGHPWTPIAYFNGEKVLTLEGLPVTKAGETYPTIYGLNIHQTLGKPAGLFGGVTFNFKNFNIDGASCNCASSFVGAVAGQVYGDLENISVKNVSFVADPSRKDIRYGAIVGMHNSGNATGCSVENAVVKAYHNVGGICGTVNESNKNRTYRDCSVKNSTFELYCTEGAGAKMVGALTGNANGVTLYYENCTAEGNNVNTLVGSGEAVDLKVPVLAVDKTAFEVEYETTQVEIQIESNIAWTVAGEGVKAEPEAGEGNAKVVLTFAANEAYEAKTYEVTVASEAEVTPVTVTITQEAAPEPEPEFVVATVAEFLDAAEDDTVYQLTGVITRVVNTTYGNFDITDETGTVYIYGLCSPEGAQQYWAESGAKLGDTITIQTVRTSYKDSPQGKDAIFVELKPYSQPSEWGVVGDLTNWSNSGIPDVVMYTIYGYENLFVAYNVEIASGAFKIRANNEWNDAKNYGLSVAGKIYADKYYTLIKGGGSQNITPMEYGTYDVYFDLANERVALVTPGKEYADAVNGGDPVVVIEGLKNHSWGVVGTFTDWGPDVPMEKEGDWAVVKNLELVKGDKFKFRGDGNWDINYSAGCDVNVGETYNTYSNGSDMTFVGEDGAYNIYFSLVDAKFYMEKYSAEQTVTFDVAPYNFANQTALTTYTVGDITFAFDGGGNNNSPKYYTSGTAVRCYPKNTITVSGGKIKKVEVVAPDGYTNAIDLYDDTTKLDNFTWEGNSEKVVLTFDPNKTSGQSRFVKINVTYE